jgi:hypothetical protein
MCVLVTRAPIVVVPVAGVGIVILPAALIVIDRTVVVHNVSVSAMMVVVMRVMRRQNGGIYRDSRYSAENVETVSCTPKLSE